MHKVTNYIVTHIKNMQLFSSTFHFFFLIMNICFTFTSHTCTGELSPFYVENTKDNLLSFPA